ncbi:MAG: LysM peptidoglycan-binding domain-containing protein [Candidatus Neomarinimicrobiota bacterium]
MRSFHLAITVLLLGVLCQIVAGVRGDSQLDDQGAVSQDSGPNRFPLILSDAKGLLGEAMIADHHGDTLEVIYLIDKIVELMTEAEQLGEMSEDDRMEYDRFEHTFLHSYEHFFKTVNKLETPIATASLKQEMSEYLESIEIEINGSKFRVIDDREGHIPLVMNKRVDRAIKFFQTKGRENFEQWLSRYPVYSDLLTDILTENELPEELVFHAMVESGLNPRAYSRARAAGLWQFISSTAKLYGLMRNWWVDERRDPIKSTKAAADYLKDLFIEFDDWYLALAAYNAGEGRIHRAIRLHQTRDFWRLNSLPRETRNHVPTFLATAIITRNPEEYGFKRVEADPFVFDEVVIERSADLSVLASCAGITVDAVRLYNPELRQFATPPEEPYSLKIPRGRKERFETAFASLPDDRRFSPQYLVHRVRRGESLSLIARKYRVSIHEIASVNKIRNYHRLQIGQRLTIPTPSSGRGPILASSSDRGKNSEVHIVRKGDTLGHIAMLYGTTARTIRTWNGLRYGGYIYPGQKLTVPLTSLSSGGTDGYSKEVYKVRTGDTLSHIAVRYRVSVGKMRKWNGIGRGDFIYPGQKLVIYVNES